MKKILKKPKMTDADKNFIQGYTCCLANAIRLEDWRYSQIGGRIKISDMALAGADVSDIQIIKAAQKIGN